MLRRPLALLLVCAALVGGAVIAGCGASSGSSASTLTAAVPRDALVYAEVVLHPSGGARAGALGAAGKLLATGDPAARLRQLLRQGFARSNPPVDFARDIEPWLGDRAAIWVGTPGAAGAKPPVGAIVQTTDAELARRRLEALARPSAGKPVERSVDGHDYEVFPRDDTALALREGEILVGTDASVRRMLTLSEDGSLARVGAYGTATSRLDRDRLATVYVDTNRFLDLSVQANPQAARQLGALRSLVGRDSLRPMVGQLTANATRMAFEMLVSAPNGAKLPGGLSGFSAANLLKQLPASSWAAFAIPRLGSSLRLSIDRAGGLLGSDVLREQVLRATGLDLRRDVTSWMGDVGVFARGTTVRSIDGGVVVQVVDRARAMTAFGKFVGIAASHGMRPKPIRVRGAQAAFAVRPPSAPRPVVLARSADRMVLAFGTAAAAEGLHPSRPLEQGPAYAQAAEALGSGFTPSMLFSFPAIVSLVDSTGKADRSWAEARPYLARLGVIATGSKVEGDTARVRFVVGLR